MKAEALYVVAEFAQTGDRRSTGQAGADNDDGVLALVGWVDQFEIKARLVPFFLNGAFWNT